MLTFFRRIRKGLLDSSQAQKYILYAIGEIALVVIGILIALQINNWNQNRHNLTLQKKYISNVISDIESDLGSFNFYLENGKSQLNSINVLLESFKQGGILPDTLIISHLNNLPFILSFDPKRSTFEDMQSSGSLNLIKNDDIRIKVTDYYSITENIRTDIRITNNYLLENLLPKIFDTRRDVNSVLKHSQITKNFMDIVEVDAFTDARFFMDNSRLEKIELINSLTFQNHVNAMNSRWFLVGIQEAELLKGLLETYYDSLPK